MKIEIIQNMASQIVSYSERNLDKRKISSFQCLSFGEKSHEFFSQVSKIRELLPIIPVEDRELEPTLGDFKCRPCGQRFGSRRGLRLHQKKFHRGYGCEDCSETFDSIGELEKHQTESGHGTHSPASSGLQNQR